MHLVCWFLSKAWCAGNTTRQIRFIFALFCSEGRSGGPSNICKLHMICQFSKIIQVTGCQEDFLLRFTNNDVRSALVEKATPCQQAHFYLHFTNTCVASASVKGQQKISRCWFCGHAGWNAAEILSNTQFLKMFIWPWRCWKAWEFIAKVLFSLMLIASFLQPVGFLMQSSPLNGRNTFNKDAQKQKCCLHFFSFLAHRAAEKQWGRWSTHVFCTSFWHSNPLDGRTTLNRDTQRPYFC